MWRLRHWHWLYEPYSKKVNVAFLSNLNTTIILPANQQLQMNATRYI